MTPSEVLQPKCLPQPPPLPPPEAPTIYSPLLKGVSKELLCYVVTVADPGSRKDSATPTLAMPSFCNNAESAEFLSLWAPELQQVVMTKK